jgi:hypothetical protein
VGQRIEDDELKGTEKKLQVHRCHVAGNDINAYASRFVAGWGGTKEIATRIERLPIVSVGLKCDRCRPALDDGLGASGVGDLRRSRPDREGHRGERTLLAAVPDRVAFRRYDARDNAGVIIRRRGAQGIAPAPIAGIASRNGEKQGSTEQGRSKDVSHCASVWQVKGRIKYQARRPCDASPRHPSRRSVPRAKRDGLPFMADRPTRSLRLLAELPSAGTR